jgi:hypothetical protein
VLLKLAYLGMSNVFAALRLLPMGERDKDTEILALRHQITVLERQLSGQRIGFTAGDRAFLAAPLHHLPKGCAAPHAAAGAAGHGPPLSP